MGGEIASNKGQQEGSLFQRAVSIRTVELRNRRGGCRRLRSSARPAGCHPLVLGYAAPPPGTARSVASASDGCPVVNCLVTRWQLVPGSPGSLRMVGETLVWSICLILQVADIERLRWQARGCRASALQSRQQPARKAGIRVHKMTTLYSFCTQS